MPRKLRMVRQLEVALFCFIAAIGYMMCYNQHLCRCGHLAHGQSKELVPWVIDGSWLFGLIAAGVVGIKGGFIGARFTAVASLLLALASAADVPQKWLSSLGTFGTIVSATHITPGSLGSLAGGTLMAAGIFHTGAALVSIVRTSKNNKSEQGGDGDAEEAV